MFKTTLSETTHRLQDMVDAWESAAHDARNACETWRPSTPGDRGDAYVRYRASLDREERCGDAGRRGQRGRAAARGRLRWPDASRSDPLALDPLGPMAIGPIADDYSPSDPLALDPLSPVDWGARPVDAHGNDSEHTSA
jgi:hypothetical protein